MTPDIPILKRTLRAATARCMRLSARPVVGWGLGVWLGCIATAGAADLDKVADVLKLSQS